jgi:hypothetical protein
VQRSVSGRPGVLSVMRRLLLQRMLLRLHLRWTQVSQLLLLLQVVVVALLLMLLLLLPMLLAG